VTVRAITGLVAYNLFLLAVGAGVLWAIRGWKWWTDFARLAGVAYFLGVASLMTLLTLELVLGVPIRAATIVFSGLAVIVGSLVVGRLRGFVLPGLRPSGWRIPGLTLFGALFAAGIVVYLEALVRADRLSGIAREWDSWAFWVPKAQSLYFFGSLTPAFLEQLPQVPSYPPGLSLLQAGAFHAMGSADATSLHVQYWFFAAGFVAAMVGLLAGRVHEAILLPVLLAFFVAPSLLDRATTVYADIPLGYLIGVAGLLVILWVEEQRGWQLAAAVVLLAGAMLTKREGILFAACVLLAAFVVSATHWRELWRRLAVAAVAAIVLTLPWRAWFMLHELEGDGPNAGYLGAFRHIDRVRPSFELAVSSLFERDLWRIVPYIALAAILIAAFAGAWKVSIYAAVFLGAAIGGATWTIWANVNLPIGRDDSQTPIDRLTGTTVLTLAALTPLLLARAWSARGRTRDRASFSRPVPLRDGVVWRSPWMWAVVALGLLSHPASMVIGYSGSGLPGGAPRWPGDGDCVTAPALGQSARVVVGYAESYPEAQAIRRRALTAGLDNVQVTQDGCGRARVFVDADSPTENEMLVATARAANLEPTLEGVTAPPVP
jgi:hypothetical protein